MHVIYLHDDAIFKNATVIKPSAERLKQ